MSNRREDLKALLFKALESADGVVLAVTGSEKARRQQALASLLSLRRELAADEPSLLNLTIKQMPGNPDEIVIKKE